MSTTMLYRFESPPPEGTMIAPELAGMLARRFFGQDGTKVTVAGRFSAYGSGFASYLEGLVDCGVPGAKILLKEVKRGSLLIWIEKE